ncbi:AbrB/MazE/SpoVT family DNA-binding domain-containing protein [Methylotuvimicrobium buryatense]|uniref:AbrB/MazE/SpoVT family DNA-binding domain-containing protein n=1 Tax=Methylotuvimicrobium buryatense TaxID=95641 RepID=A0A4V1IKC9_METBY|nr:AbrB/MazE/SpoVT family DNA-binding domain-containing protein [Methylotuvimicrobium buryatense]QCW84465.1 AbrB/MazE/SpoVT family DNA-binding domain-containing protein [Methylotuvimicrobium buryatense]
MSQLAKISSKGQVTIPADVRKKLHLEAGDTVVWETSEDGRVWVRRINPLDVEYLSAVSGTLSEWSSVEDDEAYRDLKPFRHSQSSLPVYGSSSCQT